MNLMLWVYIIGGTIGMAIAIIEYIKDEKERKKSQGR